MKMKTLIIIMTTLLIFIATICIGAVAISLQRTNELSIFKGIWSAQITKRSQSYDLQLDIYTKNITNVVKVSSSKFGFHFLSVKWNRKGNQLIFTMNDKENEATYKLSKNGNDALSGTLTQYGAVYDITFHKNSDKAVNGKYYRDYPNLTYEDRKKQLIDYSEYADDGVKIPFTYKLKQKDKYKDLISKNNLDSLVEGKHDIELMKVLLNWVSSNYKHDGNSGLPKERDANALIVYYKENGGINCRGLAIILAELLRVYKIPAKHITCMPKEVKFNDCHVVVHAYSEELKQWIMLDPTYKLILQDDDGNYINLPMLRDCLINDSKLVANEDAGRNGDKFNMDEYRKYMTKNTFRFSCETEFYCGSDKIRIGNMENMLAPLNYKEDSKNRNTTSDRAFWVIP